MYKNSPHHSLEFSIITVSFNSFLYLLFYNLCLCSRPPRPANSGNEYTLSHTMPSTNKPFRVWVQHRIHTTVLLHGKKYHLCRGTLHYVTINQIWFLDIKSLNRSYSPGTSFREISHQLICQQNNYFKLEIIKTGSRFHHDLFLVHCDFRIGNTRAILFLVSS